MAAAGVRRDVDGYLNDINGDHVRPEHVEAALDAATAGPVAEGSVGGGTGMNCYEFKGGNGTASRGSATGDGPSPSARSCRRIRLARRTDRRRQARRPRAARRQPTGGDWFEVDLGLKPPPGAGSVIAIVATDAPLLPGQCKALARRVPLGWPEPARPAAISPATSSWRSRPPTCPDLASAFPVGPVGDDEFGTLTFVPWGRMDDLYTAVVQAVEEAVLNALVVNDDMVGRDGHRSPRLPHDRLSALLGLGT